MNFDKLPSLVSYELAKHLNTCDSLNLAKAAVTSNKFKDICNSAIFSIVFNRKAIDLAKCYWLEANDWKDIMRYFQDKAAVSSINLYQCPNLVRSPGSLTIKDRFQHVTELNIIGLELELQNIVDTVNKLKLKKLALSLPTNSLLRYEVLANYKFVGFQQIQSICIEFKSIAYYLFIVILNSCLLVQDLEIMYAQPAYNFSLGFDTEFTNKFASLQKLVLATPHILINPSQSTSILAKLTHFRLQFTVSQSMILEENLGYVRHLRTSSSELDFYLSPSDNPTALFDALRSASGSGDRTNNNESNPLNKLSKLKLRAHLSNIIQNIPIDFFAAKHLLILDMRTIHLHTATSVCQLIGEHFKCLKELYLPCCALVVKEEVNHFKRLLDDDDDEETINENESARDHKAQLSYLVDNGLNIATLGIYSPLTTKTKERAFFDCQNITYKELHALANVSSLKSLHLENFKMIGSASQFREFLEGIKHKLTKLSLKDFRSFVLYEFQQIFSTNLTQFTHLESLEIENNDFHTTQAFLNALFSLEKLAHLTLIVKNLQYTLLIQNVSSFAKMARLQTICLRSDDVQSKLKCVKDAFKRQFVKRVLTRVECRQPTRHTFDRANPRNVLCIYNTPTTFQESELTRFLHNENAQF